MYEYRQDPKGLRSRKNEKTEPIHVVSDPAWVLYLLVVSIVELHEVTTLKILGNKVCRTSSPPLGSVLTSTGKQDAHDTKNVTGQHKVQNYGFNKITEFVAKKRQWLQN